MDVVSVRNVSHRARPRVAVGAVGMLVVVSLRLLLLTLMKVSSRARGRVRAWCMGLYTSPSLLREVCWPKCPVVFYWSAWHTLMKVSWMSSRLNSSPGCSAFSSILVSCDSPGVGVGLGLGLGLGLG